MMDSTWPSLVAGVATAFTAILYARASLHKLFDLTAFSGFVEDYQLAPRAWSKSIALALAILETAIAAALIAPFTRPFGLVAGAGLLIVYAGAMAININRGRSHIECGCGGPVQPINSATLLRNAALALIALLGLVGPGEGLGAAEAFTVIAGGATLFIGFLLAEQMISNASHLKTRH
ncbi:MauE/DoxX family redox-associated membrane protein [Oryzibacter oryziterrae]|uniref:MauE/DoxX family redox-associated membrane protein n=1 Tax=Oryzibacter oryziterrae TaxID=2766474 RepID=UPI001F26E05D|nr:MauE/DoxX family redox-associated membrane protein [Oryzibacter oryziterrae]